MSDERAERTRMDKAIDFLIGRHIEVRNQFLSEIHSNNRQELIHAMAGVASTVLMLESTAHRTNLPNRARLLELVEAAMPKEAKP